MIPLLEVLRPFPSIKSIKAFCVVSLLLVGINGGAVPPEKLFINIAVPLVDGLYLLAASFFNRKYSGLSSISGVIPSNSCWNLSIAAYSCAAKLLYLAVYESIVLCSRFGSSNIFSTSSIPEVKLSKCSTPVA